MVARTFQAFLSTPLQLRARLVLVALVVPLLLSFAFPLWRIQLRAPQYPKGLYIDIYSYGLDAGNQGRDLTEINILNHYIGMRAITREELRDLDWIPFALGGLALLTLRCSVLGTIRTLVDLAVLTAYVSLIAFGRFAWTLWKFGHKLDPSAPMDVEPFTPAIVGSKRIANFISSSYPRTGSLLMAAFAVGVWALLLWSLWQGRQQARQAAAAPAAAEAEC
jgi:hypothetical protein